MTADRHHPPEGSAPTGWPAPAPEERERSRELTALIRREIDGGSIPFSRFMELALYAPGLGYYSAAQPKFGEPGDFITAPEISSLFGECVANQIVQVFDQLHGGDVLEAGAGAGTLAAQILLTLEAVGRLPRRYFILELSAALRTLQRETLTQRAPQLLERVQWLDTLPSPGFRGVILGNELLDAMPVARFRMGDGEVFEQHVTNDAMSDATGGATGFSFCDGAPGAGVATRVAQLAPASGYVSEVGLQAEAWVRSVGAVLAQGVVLMFDYGFPRSEFYHPQRAQGTLMCHYRHRAHGDPLILVGLQDITAHVDFSAIAAAGEEGDMRLLGYTSQAAFLIGCGLTELAIEFMDLRPRLEQAQAISRLTAPHEMGELIKVMALGKHVREPLRGFVVQDRRSRL